MRYLGFSEGFHDAAVAIVDRNVFSNNIVFAAHAERYTGIKNDPKLPKELRDMEHDQSIFYEDIRLKNIRRERAGQRPQATPYSTFHVKHHQSHAAAGYYTAPFDKEDTVCVVVDAIGELTTTSIWTHNGVELSCKWYEEYPWSLGLFYSAITKRIGLKPNEDEFITMGMAAYGEPIVDMSWCFAPDSNWHRGFLMQDFKGHHIYDIAASAQYYLQDELIKLMGRAFLHGKKLIYGGGVALNCVANTEVAKQFDDIWIFPNPGDAGSSLGAVAAHMNEDISWRDCYLGYNISRKVNPKEVVAYLLKNKICGVANGKAEFGPRALGNRSLLGDCRYNIKRKVNRIKRRQKFRPFAPAILEEFADEYFDGYKNEYMQFVSQAKHNCKAVTHVDGSARVQVVKKNCRSVLRAILEEWYEQTRCPMLLNTSLNIKGHPMVNTERDALRFEKEYGVKVF
jgi:carbamoyltransferase